MTGRRIYLFGFILVTLLIMFDGCKKIDTLPQLQVIVLDDLGARIPGAYVALFDSAEDWNARNNPVQVWRQSDSEGKVVFMDLKEITYYIYARYDGKDNTVDEISTMEPLRVNQRSNIMVHVR
jgi:hypothetical protein